MLPTREQVLDLDPDSSICGYFQRCIAKLQEETFNNTLIVCRTLRVHETGKDAIIDPENADSKAWSTEVLTRVLTKFLSPFHILAFQSALQLKPSAAVIERCSAHLITCRTFCTGRRATVTRWASLTV